MTYLEERLQDAIKTMRSACDDAERKLSNPNSSLEEKVAAMHHVFTWGLANAGADIESAIHELQRIREREVREALEKGAS